jgi:hypothetical protein
VSLDISKLQHVQTNGAKTTAQCPACAEAGHDQKGEHLVINPDDSFGCVIYPGDSAEAKQHRKRIFALCGDREIKPLTMRPSDLGRLGRVNQSQSAGQPLKTGLLGRLGRVFQTHLEGDQKSTADKKHPAEPQLNECRKGVLSVPPTTEVFQKAADLGLPFCLVHSVILDRDVFFCEDEYTEAALVEAGAEQWSIYTKAELRQLVQQNRIAPISSAELCKLQEIKRTFHARITK